MADAIRVLRVNHARFDCNCRQSGALVSRDALCDSHGMKWIDIPPVWLLACLALTYLVGAQGGAKSQLMHPSWSAIGGLLIFAGLALMVLAVVQMWRHNTTVIPHMNADALVQNGIFALTRNPIYLGDVLVLLGCLLRWDALLAVPLVPLLTWILQVRFIVPEEGRLRAAFAADFDKYAQKTRRWI